MTVKSRMVALTARLFAGHRVTTRYVRRQYGVSKATAKRDVQTLRSVLPVRAGKLGRCPSIAMEQT